MKIFKTTIGGHKYTAVFKNDSLREILESNKRNECTFIEGNVQDGLWAIWFDYKGDVAYEPRHCEHGLSVCLLLKVDENFARTLTPMHAQLWDDECVIDELEIGK